MHTTESPKIIGAKTRKKSISLSCERSPKVGNAGWYGNSMKMVPSISLSAIPSKWPPFLIVQYSCWSTGHHICSPESRVEEDHFSYKDTS